jgi:hypothetical protein
MREPRLLPRAGLFVAAGAVLDYVDAYVRHDDFRKARVFISAKTQIDKKVLVSIRWFAKDSHETKFLSS